MTIYEQLKTAQPVQNGKDDDSKETENSQESQPEEIGIRYVMWQYAICNS